MHRDLSGFTPGFRKSLPLLARCESIGAFSNERNGLTGCSQELIGKRAVASGNSSSDVVDLS